MYSIAQPTASTTGMHISGRGKNIKEIDLATVFLTRQDKEMLGLINSFDLSHNSIEQLHQLDALVSLTRLNASHNRITRIGFLPVTITELDVSHNNLRSLESIGRLPHLRDLNVGYNHLKSLAGLARSQPLLVLRAEGNRIVSTTGLENMAQLRFLSLDHNLIDNANELHFLFSTPSLEMLSLRENPVTNMNGYRALVAQLQASVLSLDGVPLLHSEASDSRSVSETRETIKKSHRPTAVDVNGCTAPSATPVEKSPVETADRLHAGVARKGEVHVVPPNKSRDRSSETHVTAVSSVTAAEDTCTSSESGHFNQAQPPVQKPKQEYSRQQQPKKQGLVNQHVVARMPNEKRVVVNKSEKECPKTKPSSSVKPPITLAPSPLHAMERKLHETEVLVEDLQRENGFLRTRNKTVGDQLKEARRVISSQLDEINRLKLNLSKTEENERKLKDRLDKVKRGALVVDRNTHNAVDAMVVEQERLKTVYETQIADLRQQLRRAQRQLATAVTAKISQPLEKITNDSSSLPQRSIMKESEVNDTNVRNEENGLNHVLAAATCENHVEISSVMSKSDIGENTPNRIARLRATDIGKFAGELKNWLYSEMAEDARRVEEERILNQLCQSLEEEDIKAHGQS